MSDEIEKLIAESLARNQQHAAHAEGSEMWEWLTTFLLRDLRAEGYEIVPGWCADLDAAPRDGTSVDLYVRNPYSGAGYRIPDCRWSPEGCWAYVGDHKTLQHIDDSWITHWRPRPTPPKEHE